MKDIGKAPEASRVDAKVFISLPASFPIQWVGLIHGRAAELRVSAFIYHGIPEPPFQHISNAEYEARVDMYSARAVIAALFPKSAAEIDGAWILKYVPKLKALGIQINLALVGGYAMIFPDGRDSINIPSDIGVSKFSTGDEWLQFCYGEISKYASQLRSPAI